MNKILKTTKSLILGLFLTLGLPLPIYAASINGPTSGNGACGLLPCSQYTGVLQIGNISTQVRTIIEYGLSLIFVGIIIFGIYLIIKAAVTIIRSEGDPGKIEEGAKMVKAVFIGIGIIFIGIIGLILILVFFNAQSVAGVNPNAPSNTNIPFLTN